MKNNSNCVLNVIKTSLISFLIDFPNIVHKFVTRIKKKLLYDAWYISNENHSDGGIRALLLFKNDVNKNYFCNLIFKNNFDEIYLGKVGIWRLFYYFWGIQKKYDLVIASSMKFSHLLKPRSDFLIPAWVDCEIDLCCDIKSKSISKKTLKSNLKKISGNNFSYSITKDPADFNFFYHNMYLPYISKRHYRSAIIVSYEKLKKSFDNGELLQIKEGKNIVGGVIIDYKIMNDIPRTTRLGILDGNFNYVKRGALIALYFYTIQYLREKGHKKFSLGSTRPFFSDGVLYHKLNWGAKVVCETSEAFLLSIASKKKYLKSFLLCNPFIVKERNNLSLVTFSDYGIKKCPYLPKDENKIRLYGLDKMITLSL